MAADVNAERLGVDRLLPLQRVEHLAGGKDGVVGGREGEERAVTGGLDDPAVELLRDPAQPLEARVHPGVRFCVAQRLVEAGAAADVHEHQRQ